LYCSTRALFSSDLRSHFDIVGFDPRGAARSNPVACSTDLLSQRPSPVLTSQAEVTAEFIDLYEVLLDVPLQARRQVIPGSRPSRRRGRRNPRTGSGRRVLSAGR
jgi:hypothetical protein